MSAAVPRSPRHGALAAAVALGLALAVLVAPGAARADHGPDAARRIGGADRAATAAALARTLDGPVGTVVLVAWDGEIDGLAAGTLAAAQDGAVLIAGRHRLPPATATALEDLDPSRVVLAGGEVRLGSGVSRAVERITGRRPARIAGRDRIETAAALARAAGGPVPEVWVAAGDRPVDALAAGAAAAAAGGALLLVEHDRVPPAASSALASLEPDRVRVAGGAAAVADRTVRHLREFAPTSRSAGTDRYATAAEIARSAFGGTDHALVATGRTVADAVAGAPLAARWDAPVLLVPRRCLPESTVDAVGELGLKATTLLGGPAAVAPRVERGATCAEEIARIGDPDSELTHSWRPGCPVPPSELRRITLEHWTFEGEVRTGQLVVHQDHAAAIRDVFDGLFARAFPFERVTTIEDYDGDDGTAMSANATTAFNCREIAGRPGVWSQHAYGRAIDVNPVQNPYVDDGEVTPPEGRAYTDRTDVRPGMVVRGGPVHDAFAAIGWGWGGDWHSSRDYQHFDAATDPAPES